MRISICSYTFMMRGMPGGMHFHDGSMPCPPAFWSAVFLAYSAWYSGGEGAGGPAGVQRGGMPPRSHRPFQFGYFDSSKACAPDVSMSAAANANTPIELRMIILPVTDLMTR